MILIILLLLVVKTFSRKFLQFSYRIWPGFPNRITRSRSAPWIRRENRRTSRTIEKLCLTLLVHNDSVLCCRPAQLWVPSNFFSASYKRSARSGPKSACVSQEERCCLNSIPHGVFWIIHTSGGGGGGRFYPPLITQSFQKIWIWNLACLNNFLLSFQNCKGIYKT